MQVYPIDDLTKTLRICDNTSDFAIIDGVDSHYLASKPNGDDDLTAYDEIEYAETPDDDDEIAITILDQPGLVQMGQKVGQLIILLKIPEPTF